MDHYPKTLLNLIRRLAKLPGIGEKTAERLALHVLQASRSDAEQLSAAILAVKDRIRFCRLCHALADAETCGICSDTTRNAALLCVVEQPGDMAAIERSGAFAGLYHILGGALSPMNGVGPDALRIDEMLSRIDQQGVQEVVLATATSVEGEATADYIAQRLAPLKIRVTRIASGVPIGGDLKYVDQLTLKRAMDSRHAF